MDLLKPKSLMLQAAPIAVKGIASIIKTVEITDLKLK